MNVKNVEEIIDKVTTETITKLSKANMLTNNDKKAFKKTEEILRNYNKYQTAVKADSNAIKVKKLIKIIDEALKIIEDDPYFEIIEMFYFKNDTREDVAEYFNCDVKTITRNKRRLINNLKIIIFSDESISEIFFQ